MGLQEALKWAGVNNNAKFLMNTKAEKWCRFWRCTSGDTSYGLKSRRIYRHLHFAVFGKVCEGCKCKRELEA